MYFISISFDNGFLLSIIAINLTLIGLTSLAETRRVLGVDYGKFLINQAYVFWRIKFKHFIISFASINILSAISLLFTHHKVVLLLTSSFLLVSMILLLIYFISSILFVNNNVSEQIYLYTLSNLYTSLNETNREHSYFDTVLDISDGAPTKKKVVSDAYNYFNIDNFETKEAFKDIFGPESFLYNPEKNINRIKFFAKDIRKTHKNILTEEEINNPYKYRKIDENYDITHEFFQLFRLTKLQSVWAINAYYILTNSEENYISYSNIVRITCNSLLYCEDQTIRTYKYIDFLTNTYLSNVKSPKIKEYEAVNLVDKIDFNKIEKIFLEAYFELCISAVLDYIDHNHYKPIDEIHKFIEKMVNEKTIIKRNEKVEIFHDLLEDLYNTEPKFSRNLNKEYFKNIK